MSYVFGLAHGCVLTCNKYDGSEIHLLSPKDFLNYNIEAYKGGPIGIANKFKLLAGAKEWAEANPHLLPELERRLRVVIDVNLPTRQ